MAFENREPDSIHVDPRPKTLHLKETTIWPFWCRVLKIKNFKYDMRVTEIYNSKKGPHAKVRLHFARERDKAVFTMYISKSDPLYFTVAKGSNIYESEHCLTIEEYEAEFKKYFRRRRDILPQNPLKNA